MSPASSGAAQPLVRILGPIDVSPLGGRLTSQQRSLVAYLACIGPVDRERLVDALWDGRPVSTGRLLNLVSDVRRALGRDHLPDAVDGRYRLVGIETDLDDLQRAFDALSRRPGAGPGGPEVEDLAGALARARGPVLTGPAGRYWSWLDRHPELTAGAEALVAEAACRLAALRRAGGDLDGARWACERGLAASPLDQSLVVALEAVYLDQGRVGAARRLVATWRSRLRRLDVDQFAPDLRAAARAS
jgi:DNA-binding SARP family transcriptional activator